MYLWNFILNVLKISHELYYKLKFNIMKNVFIFLLNTILLFCSCSNDELKSGNFKLSLRSIDKFEINPVYNPNIIDVVYSAKIDEERKTIELQLPASLVKSNPDKEYLELIPSIKVSTKATVSPQNLEPISLKFNPSVEDFIEYAVTAEDGRTAIYTLTWNFDFMYTGADVLGYEFLTKDGTIEFQSKSEWMTLPKSWFTYDEPIKKDDLGNEIGQIKMKIVLSESSKNAIIEQPEQSINTNAWGTEYYVNSTRLSLSNYVWVNHFTSRPLYTYSVVSEDGLTRKEYNFGLNWDKNK